MRRCCVFVDCIVCKDSWIYSILCVRVLNCFHRKKYKVFKINLLYIVDFVIVVADVDVCMCVSRWMWVWVCWFLFISYHIKLYFNIIQQNKQA